MKSDWECTACALITRFRRTPERPMNMDRIVKIRVYLMYRYRARSVLLNATAVEGVSPGRDIASLIYALILSCRVFAVGSTVDSKSWNMQVG